MSIQPGTTYSETVIVDKSNVASVVGSGLVDVYATPMMIALLEKAAAACIAPWLEAGQASVGTHISVSHSGATPIGMEVIATATVTEVDRRRVEFEVVARDAAGEVGRGTHTRFVINTDSFMQKAADKAAQYGAAR